MTDTMKNILKDINKYPLLTEEEEKDLAKKWQQQHSVAAHDRLVNCNLKLVLKIANTLCHDSNDLEDAYSAGCLGLLQAADKYNPETTTRFSTYAYNWITANVKQYLKVDSRLISLPTEVQNDCYRIKQAQIALVQALETEPTLSDYAAYLNGVYDEETIQEYLNLINYSMTSLDAPINGSEDEATIGDLIVDNNVETPESYANRIERHDILISVLKKHLTDKEVKVLIARYDLDDTGATPTLEKLGEQFGCTRECIRLIINKAIQKIQSNAEALEVLQELL